MSPESVDIPALRWEPGGGPGANIVDVMGGIVTVRDGPPPFGNILGQWDTSEKPVDTLGELAIVMTLAMSADGNVVVDDDVTPNAPSALLIDQSVTWGPLGNPPLLIAPA